MTVEEYTQKMTKTDFLEVVKRSLMTLEDLIIAMNQEQLYIHSENAEGENLLTYNSIVYAIWKNNRNKAPGLMHPDLFDTGDFYRGFFLEVTDSEFELDSRDYKSDDLKDKYGENIFGLNKEHLGDLATDHLGSEIIKNIWS